MKITPTPLPNRAGNTQAQNKPAKTPKPVPEKLTPAPNGEDITQSGMQSAQLALENDADGDIDEDKVAQMQALLASGDLTVNTDELAASMLNFFQK
ncbi:flagellar biosynthesis anti-sigma factor FlgM [Enterobacteriaceae bacterium H16N7]|nr:flagellar biosynthesis anti-sigma factor FlgM [Dryocola clanedunensis]